MATPRVFISSTCYDLKYIRENLRYFVRTLGYEPILSEDGSVFYNPSLHTHDACLTEIPNSQIFVLLIGGRFGGKYKDNEGSITNAEYREAIRLKIPVFALVDISVFNEHHVYQKNKSNSNIDLEQLVFPSVDSLKIFAFIDEIRGSVVNNALVPFKDFGDIESYLKMQWAGMMYDFLNMRNEERRVSDTLNSLAEVNRRIEILSKQILLSVGTEDAKLDAELYEELFTSEAIRDIAYWGYRPTPLYVLNNHTFISCAQSLGVNLVIDEDDTGENSISSSGRISPVRFKINTRSYERTRVSLMKIISQHGFNCDDYVKKRQEIFGNQPTNDGMTPHYPAEHSLAS